MFKTGDMIQFLIGGKITVEGNNPNRTSIEEEKNSVFLIIEEKENIITIFSQQTQTYSLWHRSELQSPGVFKKLC